MIRGILRYGLLTLSGVVLTILHDLFASWYVQRFTTWPVGVGFGIWNQLVATVLIIALPISILLGEAWARGTAARKRWGPQILLIAGMSVLILPVWSHHPLHSVWWMICACSSLPYRLLIDRFTTQHAQVSRKSPPKATHTQ